MSLWWDYIPLFLLIQVLSGHGCFAVCLRRFPIHNSGSCMQCGFSPDNTEGGFFHCDAWKNWRRQTCVEIHVKELRTDNLVDTVLLSLRFWILISRFITLKMSTRKSEERTRQRLPTPWRLKNDVARLKVCRWTGLQNWRAKQAGSGRSQYDPCMWCPDWQAIDARSLRRYIFYFTLRGWSSFIISLSIGTTIFLTIIL